jgi:transcriptional regulator with XRE-family HTH domain
MPNLKVLGERLKQLRNDHNMSQDFVAGELNISRQAIISIESGKRKVDSFELFKLAKLFNADMEFLLAGDESSVGLKKKEPAMCFRMDGNLSDNEKKALNDFNSIYNDYEFLKKI